MNHFEVRVQDILMSRHEALRNKVASCKFDDETVRRRAYRAGDRRINNLRVERGRHPRNAETTVLDIKDGLTHIEEIRIPSRRIALAGLNQHVYVLARCAAELSFDLAVYECRVQ